ncbi:MAG: sigma-54-dependent Fis family transcriptional regulator [Gammaproteobacteria bacterium]|nr:sigma-54-dependent Fis family transcriptional regulator [Gammaproteobacteria bacterium]MAY03658.1 sigma-54-dependent Fis family transcriptional regulator [Gammaproteobacteria bacterium]|tara:strand:+ start:340054 stop:341490 length:1437 start_codon:yes stop_codon:yes gene_type:complete
MAKKTVLIYIVEDSVPSAMLYKSYVETLGYKAKVFHTGMDAIAALNDEVPQILIQDIQLPDINGLEIVREVTEAELPTKTIVITSNTELDYAVEATKSGAFDFIEKPFTRDRLLVTVANALKQTELMDQVQVFSDALGKDSYYDFIGSSPAMQVVYKIIDNVARSKASVFITGESGTGKELCASAIHQASPRSKSNFVPVNCAAIPKDLFESEIFGHVKGAFSGATADRQGAAEMADGGTLFLDEIGEMDMNLQAKLLRLIQSGTLQRVGSSTLQKVDVRFVCATNRDPVLEVAEGRFREDLYYRLNVVPIDLPPLRARDNDVLDIAVFLLRKFSREMNKGFTGFAPEVEKRLLEYEWPGNVRELQNVIENTVIMNDGELVSEVMLPESFNKFSSRAPASVNTAASTAYASSPTSPAPVDTSKLPATDEEDIQPLWQSEKQTIEQAIKICQGNIPVAAARLGVSPSTIYRKLKSWEDN